MYLYVSLYHVVWKVILRHACCILYIIVCLYNYTLYIISDAWCNMFESHPDVVSYISLLSWCLWHSTFRKSSPTLMARNSNLRSLLGALQQRADLAVWSPWSFQCCWAMLSLHDKMDENSSIMHYSKVDVFFGGVFLWVLVESCWCFLLSQVWKAFSREKIGLIAEILGPKHVPISRCQLVSFRYWSHWLLQKLPET